MLKVNDKEMQTKKYIYYIELAIISLLLIAFLVNSQILILVSFLAAALVILFSNRQDSTYAFAFFTSFASIFVYQGRHMFFVLAALLIIKNLLYNKINRRTVCFYLIIICYSLLFCDIQGDFSFAKLIGIILLFTIPILANNTKYVDCRKFMQHYIFGFTISTIIGFFAEEIPPMADLFAYDLMWTEDFIELTRFSGLAFDSNFYALSNYMVIAYLLFCFDKLSRFRICLIVFLVISGLQTVSKSYYLVIVVLLICYCLKNTTKIKKVLMFVLIIGLGASLFVFISNKMGYNVIDLILDRFVVGGSFADNTTGRFEIWQSYIEMFSEASIKEIVFGFGFNATVTVAAHNTIIEFFYYYGIVGCFIWGAYLMYCWKLFSNNTKEFENKSIMVFVCLFVGVFFLSAYTYEAFAMGLSICLMTLRSPFKERRKLQDV